MWAGVRVPAMKYAYPAAAAQFSSNDPPLALRIARHSPCHACGCRGLQPPHSAHVFLDTDRPAHHTLSLGHLGQYGSDDDEMSPDYLDVCQCGHGVPQHGADETAVDRSEFLRRGRVATRLDELLQVSCRPGMILPYVVGAGALLRLRASHFSLPSAT